MTVPVDGLLLDFKSTRHPGTLRQAEAWQLIGYLLLDTADQYRIDTVGLYLSRSGALASWPVEEYLELLGACRRDIAVFRSAFTELLEGCTADAERYEQEEEDRVQRLLRRLAPVADPGHCLVCTLPRLEPPAPGVLSTWCRGRAQTLRHKGLLPGGPALLLPCPRKQHLDLPYAEIVSLTPHLPR